MTSVPNPEQTVPTDVAVETILQAFKELGRADEQFAFGDERSFKSKQDAAHHPSHQQVRPAGADRSSLRRSPALLGVIGMLLAASVSVVAFAWQSFHGDSGKMIITASEPQPVSTTSLSLGKQDVPAQPLSRTADVAKLPQPAPLAKTIPQDVAPTAAPIFPELGERLQTMERDLENFQQGLEQLKTSQEQMVRDNAAVAEQLKGAQAQIARDNAVATELKASQQQMVRDNAALAEQLKASQGQMDRLIAKASEQTLRPRSPSSLPTPTPTRKPVPMVSLPQARAKPQVLVPSVPLLRTTTP